MGAQIAVAVLAACALALLCVLLLLRRPRGGSTPTAPRGAAPVPYTLCPLCGSRLPRGETVKSVVFPPRNALGIEESMARILGCPHCWPANESRPRLCPFCRKPVPPDGWVIARQFLNRRTGRTHVHVLGCTGCRKGG